VSLKTARNKLRADLLARIPDDCGVACWCDLDAPVFMHNEGCVDRDVLRSWDMTGPVPRGTWAVMTASERVKVHMHTVNPVDAFVGYSLGYLCAASAVPILCLGSGLGSSAVAFLGILSLALGRSCRPDDPFAYMDPPPDELTEEGHAGKGALSLPALDTDSGALTITPTQDGGLTPAQTEEKTDERG